MKINSPPHVGYAVATIVVAAGYTFYWMAIFEEGVSMSKLDLVKKYRSYYTSKRVPEIMEFGMVSYLSIEGKGEPGGNVFIQKLKALYSLAYGIKKRCKEQGYDFSVPRLEGLWWVDGERPAFDVPRSEWCWKLLIRMPEFVTGELMLFVQSEVASKKKNEVIREIALKHFAEGKCIQILHEGHYADESETIEKLMDFIVDNDLCVNGLHHEIYLSDPGKTEPSKMKTLIRFPVI